MIDQFKAARRASVPIINIVTPDPAATIKVIAGAYEDKNIPIIQWDYSAGVATVNKAGKSAVAAVCGDQEPDTMTNPTEVLRQALEKVPKETIFFFHNVQRFAIAENPQILQGIWNLRDAFSRSRRTLVLLGPYYEPPPELANDIVRLEEPLPSPDQLRQLVKRLAKSAERNGMPQPDGPLIEKAVDALRGLPMFPAEQVTALACTPEGLNLDALWERKRQMIEATPGLSVWRGGERLDDLGGLANIKGFLRKILAGKSAPKGIAFVDEIEKSLAGAAGIGDSTGTSQAMLSLLLRYMQDKEATGIICVGPPGTGKSMLAKAAGSEAGIPVVAMSIENMKGQFVGQSEQAMTQALKVLDAVAERAVLFIATCNSIAVLPPELRRRFSLGTYFFDIGSTEEQAVVWEIYRKKYGLLTDKLPAHKDWTPAEIRQCCDIARRLECSLLDAAMYVVPVAVSAKEQINNLRFLANGRFISASEPGFYKCKPDVKKLDIEPIRMIGGEVN